MAIVIADQFNLEVNKSLDDRLVVDSTTTLYSKFNNLNSYVGMLVYVEAENAYYSLNEYTEAGNADSTCWSKVMSVSGDGETSVDHATSADQATSDSEGQNIAETYVKEIGLTTLKDSIGLGDSGSDYSILVTKGDGTDYKVNIPLFTSSKDGLVPSPGASNTTKYLRGDGTWATPADTDVTNTLDTTNKAYITGTTSDTTNTGTQIFNTDHYIQGKSLYSSEIVTNKIQNKNNTSQYIRMGITNNDTDTSDIINNNIIIGSINSKTSNPKRNGAGYNDYDVNAPYVHFADDIQGGDFIFDTNTNTFTSLTPHWHIYQGGDAGFHSISIPGEDISDYELYIGYNSIMRGNSYIRLSDTSGLVGVDKSDTITLYSGSLNLSVDGGATFELDNDGFFKIEDSHGAYINSNLDGSLSINGNDTISITTSTSEGNILIQNPKSRINLDADGKLTIENRYDSDDIRSHINFSTVGDIDMYATGSIDMSSAYSFRITSRGGKIDIQGESGTDIKDSTGTTLVQIRDDIPKLRNSQGTNFRIEGTGIVSELQSHTFKNVTEGDVSLILDRGTKANWKILNTGGILKFQNDYTTTKGEYFDVLTLSHNTGDAKFKNNVTANKFIGSLQGNADTATKLKTARTIALSGAATGTATSFDGTKNITIPVTTLDATKLTGMIPIASIPQGALERLVPVANQAARFALTADNVQLGDTVKEQDTGKMYYVVDTSKLNSEDGYEVYTAGAASSVPWSGITGKPSTFTPSSHTQAISTITGIKDLTIKLGSSGSTQTYNPSTALNLEVTPASIGAATSGHNHNTTYLKLSGGTMTGNLNMNGHNINSAGDVIVLNRLWADRISINPMNSTNALLLESSINMNNHNIIQVGTVSATTLEGSLTTDYLVDGDEELIIFGGTALD